MISKALVLIVDDRPEEFGHPVRDELNKRGLVRSESFHPSELTHEILDDAVCILVDYKIEEWPSRDALTEPALQPRNGLALASVLREHLDRSKPTAICILSAALEELYGDISPDNRRHVLARVSSLEWIFSKSDERRLLQVECLSQGIKRLRELEETSRFSIEEALNLSEALEFREAAADQIWLCVPPVNELNRLTHGLAFVRWFAQRVLPYPTFLIDKFHLAAHLGLSYESLSRVLGQRSDLSEELAQFQYSGILNDFLGPRWWRAGLQSWLFRITDGKPFNPQLVREALLHRAPDTALEKNPAFPSATVVVDSDFLSQASYLQRDNCVAVMPDDWPSYADPAFVSLADAKSRPELRVLVRHDERWRLEA